MSISPDIQGFADAQERLRTDLGQPVRFYGPADILYDPDLAPSEFDDEGIPLDPLALASGVNVADVEIANLTVLGSGIVNVVYKPLQTSLLRQDRIAEQQTGIRSAANKDLIIAVADLPLAQSATHFQVGHPTPDGSWSPAEDELWKIVNVKLDVVFGDAERGIVYGEGTR